MHDLYIAEIYRRGTIFLPLIVCMRLNVSTQRALDKSCVAYKMVRFTVVQGHSRWSKLVPIESSYAISYQSFIVINCNPRCTGNNLLVENLRVFRRITYPCLVWSHSSDVHLEHKLWRLVYKTRVPLLPEGETRMIQRLLILTQYQRVNRLTALYWTVSRA